MIRTVAATVVALVLLAAAGMQTDDWYGVPPAHLFRIVRALRSVGLPERSRKPWHSRCLNASYSLDRNVFLAGPWSPMSGWSVAGTDRLWH